MTNGIDLPSDEERRLFAVFLAQGLCSYDDRELVGAWMKDERTACAVSYIAERHSFSIEEGPMRGGHWGHEAAGGIIPLVELPDGGAKWLAAVDPPDVIRLRIERRLKLFHDADDS